VGIVQPRLEAEILLASVLGVDRLHLYLYPEQPLSADERLRYREVIKQRRSGVPLQHLTGEVSFLGLRFRVTSEALIPRPETEELVEKALAVLPRDQAVHCLDLGTGSGVIAICLAKFHPQAEVTAVDVSEEALALARENAERHDVLDRIAFVQSDWFSRVDERFDLIVSNPPYVDERELATLPVEVRGHEPRVALDGGVDGTQRIRELAADLRDHLRPGASVMLEIGEGQGQGVVEQMVSIGLVETLVEEDLAGKERFVIGRCP
jgi:release factor glutamine methyltransferase